MEPQSSPTGFCGNENLEIPYQSLKERHEGKGPDPIEALRSASSVEETLKPIHSADATDSTDKC
jgi:hypothetical protein